MKYNLTTPCGLCPFRNDSKRLHVPPERLEEMASGEFCCHNTTDVDDKTGDFEPKADSQHCAGALIFNEHRGQPHQMARICERLRLFDPSKLDMRAPVFEDMNEVEDAEPIQSRRSRRPMRAMLRARAQQPES